MNYLLEVCLAVTLATGVMPSTAAHSQAIADQAMQKGVSVRLPVTSNAVPMPDADQQDALIVSITHDGSVYFGVNPLSPAALAERVKGIVSNRTEQKTYIKADARTPYANVLKVLDAVRTAGVEAPSLLTAQRDSSEPGVLVLPKGLEVFVGPSLPFGSEAIIVQVLNSGQGPALRINNEPVASTTLQTRLGQLFQDRSKKVVQVRADGILLFADVVDVVDVCRSLGARVVLVEPEP